VIDITQAGETCLLTNKRQKEKVEEGFERGEGKEKKGSSNYASKGGSTLKKGKRKCVLTAAEETRLRDCNRRTKKKKK